MLSIKINPQTGDFRPRQALLVAAMALALPLAACGEKAGDPDKEGAIDTAKIAEEAMLYGFPMIMNYGAMYDLNLNPKSSQFKGPPNTLVNEARVFTPADTAIVTPNSDTPYSMLQVDLRAEPIVICVPAVPKERYYSVQMVDMYTFNYGYIGSRATGNDAGCYMIAGPDWKGETPAGIKQVFRNETQFGLTIFRTQLFNPADIENVKKIQAGYKVQPLSAFLGQPAPPAAPAIDWPVFDKEKAKTGFFNYLNFIMQFTPPVPEEADMRARFATIGIVPGQPFDFDKLSEVQKAAVLAGMKAGQDKIDNLKMGSNQNGWSVDLIENNRTTINGDWTKRAAIAKAGIYANDYFEATYPLTRNDSTGEALDGSKASYTITFPGNAMPPVNAFWSVTMYDGKTQLLIENPINRYLVNSPMLPNMVKNADGGVTIYISKDSPGKDKEANWLPAPNGPIYLVMRLYWPKDELKNGTWQPPGVIKAGA
jgi:hypothetical protein